ncbi:Uncharacterised protein [Mycobacteroides abscessus subsp. abscessus]|nr:Uncharacterised protein [Mycobacteroides abscessus subsp. abscessus]
MRERSRRRSRAFARVGSASSRASSQNGGTTTGAGAALLMVGVYAQDTSAGSEVSRT